MSDDTTDETPRDEAATVEQPQADAAADAEPEAETVVDGPAPVDEAAPTQEQPVTDAPEAAAPAAPAPSRLDGRAIAIGGGAGALLILAFIAGVAVGDHQSRPDGPHGRVLAQRIDGGPGMGAPGRGQGGGFELRQDGPGGPSGSGGPGGWGGPGGGSDERERGGERGGPGGMFGRRGGGIGVVEKVSDDELTLAPIGGGDERTYQLDDDVEVQRRGGDGARDVEDAELDDIDEGDIVVVRGERGDSDDDESTATRIVILRDADE